MKTKWAVIIYRVIFIISVVIVLALVGFYVWLLVTYGGKPIDEVPIWVMFFLFSKGR